jgi:hypothetical protein
VLEEKHWTPVEDDYAAASLWAVADPAGVQTCRIFVDRVAIDDSGLNPEWDQLRVHW